MTARKIIVWIVLLIVVANVALIGVVLYGTVAELPLAPPVPKPNGHDDFVAAEKMLPTKLETYGKSLTYQELRDVVITNAAALNRVRTGLSRECAVPLEELRWKHDDHLAELNDFKLIDYAFSAEAGLAEMERRTNDAANILVELIQFSHAVCRGGAYPDASVGGQAEYFGLSRLLKLTNALSARECARIAKTLEDIDAQNEPLEQIVRQNTIYSGKQTFSQSWFRVVHFRRVRNAVNLFASKYNEETKDRRRAMVAFAARAYTLTNGKPPASLSDLVPTYLKTAPQDPSTGGTLEYKF